MSQVSSKVVELEISTNCPIGCPACPRNIYDKKLWNTGFTDVDLLKKFLVETNYSKYIFCGAYGDALYHPKLIEIINFMIKHDKSFMIETNGSYRKENFWEQLSKVNWNPKKHVFVFSIDGLEDTNHIYRKNSDWNSIIKGIKYLISVPKDTRPYMMWKYLVFPYNVHQIDQARELSKKLEFDEFKPYKSLRQYDKLWFENEQERRAIEWI